MNHELARLKQEIETITAQLSYEVAQSKNGAHNFEKLTDLSSRLAVIKDLYISELEKTLVYSSFRKVG